MLPEASSAQMGLSMKPKERMVDAMRRSIAVLLLLLLLLLPRALAAAKTHATTTRPGANSSSMSISSGTCNVVLTSRCCPELFRA